MEFITHFHSGMRYLILLGLVISIVLAIKGIFTSISFSKAQGLFAKLTVIFTHIQFLLGLVLYFTSGKVVLENMKAVMSNPILRFFTVEHALGMIIAIILITIGNAKVKRTLSDRRKHQNILIYFSISIIIIFVSIPWSFMGRF